MPVYEYYCKKCRKKFEALRPMSQADAPIECKYCHSRQTTRQMSRFAARSGGKLLSGAGGGGGCSGCSGGSCSTCGH